MSSVEEGSAGPPAEEGSGGMEEASHLLDTLESLPLKDYFSMHPHPIYVLPSPRLSSSSAPSLKAIWANAAAHTCLGSSLESCLDEAEQQTLKGAIAQLDLAQEDSSLSEARQDEALAWRNSSAAAGPGSVSTGTGTGGTGTTGTDGSVASYFDEVAQSHELSVFRPDWNVHKTFYALVTRSPHPSFCVLHLHPPPKKLATRRGEAVPYRGQYLPPPTLHNSARSSIAPSSRAGGSRRGLRSSSEGGGETSVSGSYSFTNSTFSGSLGIPPQRSRLDQVISEEAEEAAENPSSHRSLQDDDDARERRDLVNADSDEEVVLCADIITKTDWAQTPLGPRATWPGSLRTALSILLKTPNECVIWWGPEFLMLYNDLHAKSIGSQHPSAFGRPAAEAWGDTWSEYKAMAESVMNDGAALAREDDLIFLNEVETYQSWRWTPLTRGDGSTGGVMINSLDVTRKILKQRWLMIIRDLSTRLSTSRTIAEFSENVLKTVEQSPEDFSFAYLYAAKNITAATTEDQDIQLQLAGTVGVPYLHSSAPQTISLNFKEFDKENPQAMPDETGRDGTPWPFREAFMTRRMVMIWDLAPELADALEHRSWGDPPTSAVCIPITDDWENGRLSFLIVGLNTRRPYDADYEEFIVDVQSILLSNLKGIALFESEAKRLKQLEELDRAKTVFFTTISHELKTPLTLIKGPIHDLSKGEHAPKRKKMFTLALRNINRLARLVDGLMDFARLEAGRLRGTFRPTDLGPFTVDLASSFRSAMELSGIDFVVDYDQSWRDGMVVYADRDFWEKVVFNLVGNAYKYTLTGSIVVTARYLPQGFVFSVKDTGVGIAKPEQALVFERFHRVEGTARSHEGTGIGLSLTLELVSLSGGQLTLDSVTAADCKEGQTSGSTFTVTIPYGKQHLPPNQVEDVEDNRQTGKTAYGDGILAEASRWGKGGQSDSNSGSASASMSDSGLSASDSVGVIDLSALYWAKDKDCILVVDDSSDMVAYLRSLLGPYCRILTAGNGQEGLDVAIKHRPDLIISDVSMPVMDGVTFLSHIRRREDTELIPFILLTARSSDEDKVDGLLLGADDYLTKPFSGKELVARAHLQTQLGKKRTQLAQKFREQLKTNQLLIESSPIGIGRVSASGEVEQLNESYYRMTGQPKDVPKSAWLDYVAETSRQDAVVAFEKLKREDSSFSCELLWVSGTWTYTQVVPLAGEKEQSHGVICTHTDITDRKRLQEMEISHERSRFEAAEAQRQKADEEKRQQEFLISVISHELRNPVSAILQCCNLVRGNLAFLHEELKRCLEPDPPFVPSVELLDLITEDLDALDSIHEMAMSQERIANDVLSMGKLTLNTLEICPIPVNLVAEGQKTIATFATECRTKHIKLDLNVGEQLQQLHAKGCRVFMADPVRFGQICLNLVSNAIRFTATAPTRKIVFHLDVRRSPPTDDSCRLPPMDLTDELPAPDSPYYLYGAVEDTGPGLKPEELELLFRRFSQANKATHTVFGGSGLGLYVSRILTQIMGGRIEVESVVDKGSTFRFFLKIATGPVDGQLSKDKPKPLPVFDRPMHILIVEDNDINSRVLSRQLLKASLTFEIAVNGREGLDKIIASMKDGVQNFDAVLMDINMPVLNGIEATRKIREMEASGELPRRTSIIGLTGNAQEEQVAETKEAGMDHTIIKPYKIDDVLWTLKSTDPSSSKPDRTSSPSPSM